ncbi:16S rRNA (guanine(527)-N(7))-methyltransferase RsmG [Salipiger sp. CCB-MM3]|uniref:16S rRNA (guanine(527)-N(7))-methyltransferase RsmG n=1 Tax=Salipiger sp. CCB-MM3 TaxID=1792508 RepID=UPI00080ABADA|nr:16S rRNA (guanine(527)-N(7))-methyltransferase RsmG [Salipiger sp. CCB-MM3]ANT60256.1 16S rRNA (guanine(527)-N(7))-methyltransferase RsmG [Salipiger sp. CCB-MM3]
MSFPDLGGGLSVSRETWDRLEHYTDLLKKWNPRINLVSPSTLDEAWTRHIVDSAQIWQIPQEKPAHWADLGSGGGFPGLVVAILRDEFAPDMKVTLVESDQRKCAFLRTVLRETGATANVEARRIEEIPSLKADVLSARALASLDKLLGFADHHLSETGMALFPKGAQAEKEIAEARKMWQFKLTRHTSLTDPNAVVLQIGVPTHV